MSRCIFQTWVYDLTLQILVKKFYAGKKKRQRRRNWKLKNLDKEVTGVDQDSLEGYLL